MPKRYIVDEPDDSSWDLNQERAFWERLLNQKINFFLAFFVILIIGAAVANTKELTLFILSVGAIILWVLTVSIINTTRKINFAVKELSKSANHPTGIVDRKAKGRLVRLILGFGLPIFCASVITLIFLAGLSGLYSFNFPNKPEVIQSVQSTIEKGKEALIEKKKIIADDSKHFKSVDSVISQSRSVRVSVPLDSTSRFVSKPQVVPAPAKVNPNFKSIDRVIASEANYSVPMQPTKVSSKQVNPQQTQVSDPNFRNIDKVISSSETLSTQKQPAKILPKQQKVKPIQENNPNFKSIEKVITTEKD